MKEVGSDFGAGGVEIGVEQLSTAWAKRSVTGALPDGHIARTHGLLSAISTPTNSRDQPSSPSLMDAGGVTGQERRKYLSQMTWINKRPQILLVTDAPSARAC